MRAEFGGDPTREAKISGVPLLELLPDRGHREDRDAGLLAFIDELSQVHEGVMFVGRPDEDGESDRGRVQADGLFHRGCDLLVRQVLVQDARPATHPEHNRDVRPRIDRGADHASGDHDGIGEGKQRFQGLPGNLELVGRTEEISVVRREHDRVAVFGADDPRKTTLKSPRHLVTSWSKSLELLLRIHPFAALLRWQRHGPGTVLRLPRDHYRKVAKAAEECLEALKKHELAHFEDSYLYQQTDDCADWFTIFFLGPLLAYILQHADNRQRQREALDRLFAEMTGYILISPD